MPEGPMKTAPSGACMRCNGNATRPDPAPRAELSGRVRVAAAGKGGLAKSRLHRCFRPSCGEKASPVHTEREEPEERPCRCEVAVSSAGEARETDNARVSVQIPVGIGLPLTMGRAVHTLA